MFLFQMQHNAYLQSDNIYPMSPVVLCCVVMTIILRIISPLLLLVQLCVGSAA